MNTFNIVSIEAQVYRVPIQYTVRTSFGMMRDRPAVVVRAEDAEGNIGWGETWCNFPTVGAEHRARLINENCADILCGQEWQSPRAAFAGLTSQLHVLTLQTAEPGPIAQAIAGIDIALWDMAAKRAGVPLYHHLAAEFGQTDMGDVVSVACYASGINPDEPEKTALRARDEGYTAFKLKVGFEDELDHRNLKEMRNALGPDAKIMTDANQRWDVTTAIQMTNELGDYNPYWIEEPIAADRPTSEWRDLCAASPIDLAAGENLRGGEFTEVCEDSYLKFIQPDIAKWGGFSGCFPVAKKAGEEGKIYCPHYLGGGIGLLASAHLLAAIGGPGILEIDCNPNSLREQLAEPFPSVTDGMFELPQTPGLGIEPGLEDLAPHRTL
jgi:L-alanine-DL-glutamate epimerase-like enolase superfamily enzyme